MASELSRVVASVPRLEEIVPLDAGDLQSEFYQNFSRAHASIRLRLAGATYKYLKQIKGNETYKNVLTAQEIAFMEGLPSYHLTECHRILSQELDPTHVYYHDAETGAEYTSITLANSLSSLVHYARDQDLHIDTLNPLFSSGYGFRFNPDVEGLSLPRSINRKMGFVDRERELQERDIAALHTKRDSYSVARNVLYAAGVFGAGMVAAYALMK